MKFSRSNFKMQRFESRSPRLGLGELRSGMQRFESTAQPASPSLTHTELGRAQNADQMEAFRSKTEALGTLTGAYMGGLRGVVMMQTSGFALDRERARVAGRALPDPGDHRGLGARHAR